MTAVEVPLLRRQAYVDGAWVDADSGETFAVVNPATGETLAEVPRMGAEETRRALAAAERALPEWRARTAKDRARVLRRLADLMLEQAEVAAVPGEAPRLTARSTWPVPAPLGTVTLTCSSPRIEPGTGPA